MKTQEHTPTPWFYDDGGFSKGGTVRQSHDQRTRGYIRRVEADKNGNYVSVCRVHSLFGSEQQDADAAFIVRSVNSHEELLKAARNALDWMLPEYRDSDVTYALEIAIAKAEGK